MKAISLLGRSVVATVLVSASVAAFAGGGAGGQLGTEFRPYASSSPSHGPVSTHAPQFDAAATADTGAVSGKTRAQVRAELVQAEQDGLLPFRQSDYPPGPNTIAHNREIFQQAEKASHMNGQLALAGRQ
jgi:hypothetical protein